MQASRFENLLRALALLLIAVVAIAVCSLPAQGKEIFCAQQEGSSNAVLLDKPNPFSGKTVAKLKVNDKLEVLDETSNKSYIKVRTAGGVEGWIMRGATSEKYIPQVGEKGNTVSEGGSSSAAAKGLNSQIEADLKKNDPKYAERMKTIDALEISFNQNLGGGNKVVARKDPNTNYTADENVPVDPAKIREMFTKFGVDGGVLKIVP